MTHETREVSLRARDLVDQGWCKNDYKVEIAGSWRYCVVAAIHTADDRSCTHTNEIVRLACKHLSIPVSPTSLGSWNDRPYRTQAEVVALLEAVASQSDPLAGWREIEV
ncbi:MAG: hypothetical protein P4L67_04535 [Candidatus Pacebacteria bacterium]|nr:hypothetical protein [Candidatus Paceibacterota bacterium]